MATGTCKNEQRSEPEGWQSLHMSMRKPAPFNWSNSATVIHSPEHYSSSRGAGDQMEFNSTYPSCAQDAHLHSMDGLNGHFQQTECATRAKPQQEGSPSRSDVLGNPLGITKHTEQPSDEKYSKQGNQVGFIIPRKWLQIISTCKSINVFIQTQDPAAVFLIHLLG